MSDEKEKTPTELINFEAARRVTTFMDPAIWAQMKAMAETLRQSGMLPTGLDSVPKILVVMQTGFENGLKPMESFGSLYVVNGAVNYYGKAVTRRFREHGWQIAYSNESDGSVTATVTNMKNIAEFYTETYTFAEAEESGYTSKGGALKFGWKKGLNRRLKLRYGVLSIIIKSYIPEILGSAKGIVEVEEDVIIEEAEPVESVKSAPVEKGKTNLDEFIQKSKEQQKSHRQPVKQKAGPIEGTIEKEKAVDAEIVEPVSEPVNEERRKLEKRYFAILKEMGTEHETVKSLFGFEHLKDLDDKALIDMVGELSQNKDNKGK